MLPDINVSATHIGGNSVVGLRDRVLLLESLDQGGNLDQETLTLVAEHARPQRFRKGDLLLRDNEPVDRIYLITRGKVTVTQRGRPVRVFDQSGAVGLNAVMAEDNLGVRAIADVDTHTLSLPVNILMDLYEANFALVRNSLRVISNQILDARDSLPIGQGEDADMGEWRDRPRTFVERLIEVRRGALFTDTNLDAVLEFARQGYEIRGSAGDVLWEVGESSNYWVGIDYGRVRCSTPDGRSVVIGADYVLGVMDAMGARVRSYKVEALTDYIGFRINRDVMLAILEAHFDLARKILASLSEMVFRNRAADSEIADTDAAKRQRASAELKTIDDRDQ